MSERTGRGGRNEDAKKNLPDTVVLGAVGYMLDNDTKAKEGSLNLTSLFKNVLLQPLIDARLDVPGCYRSCCASGYHAR